MFGRAKERADASKDFRDEVREDNNNLRTTNVRLEADRDRWRMDYYVLMDAYQRFRVSVYEALHRAGASDIVLPEMPKLTRGTDDE